MRQELIDQVVAMLSADDLASIAKVGSRMTEQERRYAIGVIEDRRDDALNALTGWTGRARAIMVKASRAAVQK